MALCAFSGCSLFDSGITDDDGSCKMPEMLENTLKTNLQKADGFGTAQDYLDADKTYKNFTEYFKQGNPPRNYYTCEELHSVYAQSLEEMIVRYFPNDRDNAAFKQADVYVQEKVPAWFWSNVYTRTDEAIKNYGAEQKAQAEKDRVKKLRQLEEDSK